MRRYSTIRIPAGARFESRHLRPCVHGSPRHRESARGPAVFLCLPRMGNRGRIRRRGCVGQDRAQAMLEAMFGDAHRRAFDVLLFWSFDRLTRRGPDDAADVLARIEAMGCEFVSYREPSLNTMGPWKRILIDLLPSSRTSKPKGSPSGRRRD